MKQVNLFKKASQRFDFEQALIPDISTKNGSALGF